MSVPEFCQAFRISVPFYYKLRRQGLGPREMKLGSRAVISMAAANEWITEREGGPKNEQKAP
jgi:predicted DNA-binding transcriptional regulator AlpA